MFTYVVQPKDTLRELCVSMLGRYDNAVRAKIRQLNPNLKNPEHLDPGKNPPPAFDNELSERRA